VIRRKAYAMIKKVFGETASKSLPTVQVASNVEPLQAVAAQQSLELIVSSRHLSGASS
jgi:hypothetical protein